MGTALLIQGVTTALFVGLSCGTCCSPGIGVFLSTYMMSHAEKKSDAVRSFIAFYLGKILSVAAVCILASLTGNGLLGDSEAGNGIRSILGAAIDVLMIGAGIIYICRWFSEGKGRCRKCGDKEHKKEDTGKMRSSFVLMGMGAGYGITPCAPLILIAGYSASVPVGCAVVTGILFASASALSPLLIVLLLSGCFAGRMKKEIPEYLKWFRLLTYILLIGFFAADLVMKL